MKSAIIATLLPTAALAASAANAITYPDKVLDLHFGDTVEVSYTTNYETPWLYIFCQNADALSEIIYYSPSALSEAKSVKFELTYDYMPTGSCFFNLRPDQRAATDNDPSVGVSSPAFKYNQKEGDHETFAAGKDDDDKPKTTATTTTGLVTASSPPVSSSSAVSSSAPPPPTETGDNSDPTSPVVPPEGAGSRVGVAVGAALFGVVAMLA